MASQIHNQSAPGRIRDFHADSHDVGPSNLIDDQSYLLQIPTFFFFFLIIGALSIANYVFLFHVVISILPLLWLHTFRGHRNESAVLMEIPKRTTGFVPSAGSMGSIFVQFKCTEPFNQKQGVVTNMSTLKLLISWAWAILQYSVDPEYKANLTVH